MELQTLNESFVLRYELRRQAIRTRLLDGVNPLIIRLSDQLVFLHEGQRRTAPLTPRRYHDLKSVCHVPVAVYLWLADLAGQPLAPNDARGLGRLRHELAALAPSEAAQQATVGTLFEHVDGLLEATMKSNVVALEALSDLAAKTRPLIEQLIQEATLVELRTLHRAVRDLTDDLDAAQWSRMHVVICGSHQARHKEVTKSYFQRLLGEEHGTGAAGEHRITYAEDRSSVGEALELLASQLLERELALAFLGRPDGMQQDIQGESAARILDEVFTPNDRE